MAVTVILNGTPYTIPSPGDSNLWGPLLNQYLIALASGVNGGVSSLGPASIPSNANGASIVGGVLTVHEANGVFPGLLSERGAITLNALGMTGSAPTNNLNDLAQVLTVDATPTPIPFVGSNIAGSGGDVFTFALDVAAREGNANGAAFGLIGTFQQTGPGTFIQIGTTVATYTNRTDPSWSATLGIDGAGLITVTVIGAVASTVSWMVLGRLAGFSQPPAQSQP